CSGRLAAADISFPLPIFASPFCKGPFPRINRKRDCVSIITSKHRHVNFSAVSENVTEISHSQCCGRMHDGDGHRSGKWRLPAAMPQSAAWLHKRTEPGPSFFSVFSL
ncbi:hypothetical protein CPAR01_11196, partial [Colletotrichum paranaense]